MNERLELQILSTKIQEKITSETPPLSEAELESYYEAEKAKQFTKPPTRDVRVVVNENKKEVEEAQKALEADNSAASWKKVTKKYSPTTAAQGGLQKEISEEFLQEPLKKDIFKSETGELIGPVKQAKSYSAAGSRERDAGKSPVVRRSESDDRTDPGQPERRKILRPVGRSGLHREVDLAHPVRLRLRRPNSARTSRAPGIPPARLKPVTKPIRKCPAKECPAPVVQNQPAVPGSVTLQNPEGERLVQRPRPEELSKAAKKAAAAEAAAGAEGAPPAAAEGAEGSAESEAAQKAVEEAAAKAAEEAAAKGESEASKGGRRSLQRRF